MKIAKNSMSANALIPFSFKTRMLYPSTFSKLYKVIHFFIFYYKHSDIFIQEYLIQEST
jgi:hypothetical protein